MVQTKIKKLEKECVTLADAKEQQMMRQAEATEHKTRHIRYVLRTRKPSESPFTVRDHARLELDTKELEARIHGNDDQMTRDNEELVSVQTKIQEQAFALRKVALSFIKPLQNA